MSRNPLVSVIIPNYNHADYLEECIESVLAQTYENVEIVLLDNASTDASMRIADKYRKQGVTVCRNSFNIYSASYRILSEKLITGEYMMMVPADDYILPEFIATGIQLMEENINIGYVHMEREFIQEDGTVIPSDPFYNCSFMAEGRKVMPVYMVTTVAHPVQGIFRRSAFERIHGYDAIIHYANADKTLWFYLATVSDYAYMDKKLARVRIGRNTQTNFNQRNFQHPVLIYLTLTNFLDYAKRNDIPEVYRREQESFEKIANEFLTICVDLLLEEEYDVVNQYLIFCKILSREIEQSARYQELYQMWNERAVDKPYLQTLKSNMNTFGHRRGYEPPIGYQKI